MNKYNFILITLDGMRRDRLDLCPFIKKLSEQNIFFSNIMTAAPYTIGSMHALLSGIYPTRNGVNSYYNMFRFKRDNIKTLAQYFSENGYYTIADVYSSVIIPHQGYCEINLYDEKAADINESGIFALRKAGSKKNFFLHLQPSHIHKNTVKNIGKVYTDFDENYFNRTDKNIEMYNSFLEPIDKYVEKIFEEMKILGLDKNTIVIINTDHGTSNGERMGEMMYGCYLYDYTMHSMCIIVKPEKLKKEINYYAQSVDILPTFLDLADIKIDKSFESLDGKSLKPFIEDNENQDRITFSETGRINKEDLKKSEHNIYSVINNKIKIIYFKNESKYELYDLENDPLEQKNLSHDKELLNNMKLLLSEKLIHIKIINSIDDLP